MFSIQYILIVPLNVHRLYVSFENHMKPIYGLLILSYNGHSEMYQWLLNC